MITKMIATLTVVLLVGLTANVYAAPDRVTVDSFPFEITMEEQGEITIINTDALTHTFELSGVFSHTVEAGEGLVFNLPASMTEDNKDGWYLLDQATGGYNIIHTEAKYVAPPPAPVYVAPQPEPIAEPSEPKVNFGTASSETSGEYESIRNVPTYNGNVDVQTLQSDLADITAKFNKSVQTIAEQKTEIRLLNANVTSLKSQPVVTVDTSALDSKVLALEANNTALANEVRTITADRDEWKTLAESWYGIAKAQLKVMVDYLGL
jgi:hypothetical protein